MSKMNEETKINLKEEKIMPRKTRRENVNEGKKSRKRKEEFYGPKKKIKENTRERTYHENRMKKKRMENGQRRGEFNITRNDTQKKYI